MLLRTGRPEFFLADFSHSFCYIFFMFLRKRFACFSYTDFSLRFIRKWTTFLSLATFPCVVMRDMLAPCHQCEIFWAIICDVTIDMVDNFILGKWSTKNVFHYQSMLKNVFTVSTDHSVSRRIYPSFSISCPIFMKTTTRTKKPLSKLRGIFFAYIPTIQASNLDFSHVSNIAQIEAIM